LNPAPVIDATGTGTNKNEIQESDAVVNGPIQTPMNSGSRATPF